MDTTLCPTCGAYWRCNCRVEALTLPALPACQHDWQAAVAVDIDLDDDDLDFEHTQVMLCRLCGLYAVQQLP